MQRLGSNLLCLWPPTPHVLLYFIHFPHLIHDSHSPIHRQLPWMAWFMFWMCRYAHVCKGFPSGSAVKNLPAGDEGDAGWISGSERFPGGGNGNPLQCSCLQNSTDRGVWWAIVHRVVKSWTRLKQLSTAWACLSFSETKKEANYCIEFILENQSSKFPP